MDTGGKFALPLRAQRATATVLANRARDRAILLVGDARKQAMFPNENAAGMRILAAPRFLYSGDRSCTDQKRNWLMRRGKEMDDRKGPTFCEPLVEGGNCHPA